MKPGMISRFCCASTDATAHSGFAAAGLLDTISRYLQTSFPDIGESRSVSGLEASSAPCTAAVYEDQTEDWQTTFTMQYMQEG